MSYYLIFLVVELRNQGLLGFSSTTDRSPATTQSSVTPFPLSNVMVRLSGGLNNREGRVEVYYNSQWGTVCSDGWNTLDTGVVCRMLGYQGVSRPVLGTVSVPMVYGAGSGPIFLRGVQCDGNEQNIAFCPFQGWNIVDCVHNEDAGAICLGDRISISITVFTRSLVTVSSAIMTSTKFPQICNKTDLSIRLVNSNNDLNASYGKVFFNYNNIWKEICTDNWGLNEAMVVCKMICFNPINARLLLDPKVAQNGNINYWLTTFVCNGNENNLYNCKFTNLGIIGGQCLDSNTINCLPDNPQLTSVPNPVIECDTTDIITAKFSLAKEPKLKTKYLNVCSIYGSLISNCNYTSWTDSVSIYIAIPFIGCNTSRNESDSFIYYTNYILYSIQSESTIITRMEAYIIPVTCLIAKLSSNGNAFLPVSIEPSSKYGTGNYNVQLVLFQDSTFKTVLMQNPLPINLGDWLYVGVLLISSDPNLKLVLINCYVSPFQNSNIQPIYSLISNRCAIEPTLTMFIVNNTLFGIRFQSLKFIANYNSSIVYLHADVSICYLNDNTGTCSRSCPSFKSVTTTSTKIYLKRKRRLVVELLNIHLVYRLQTQNDKYETTQINLILGLNSAKDNWKIKSQANLIQINGSSIGRKYLLHYIFIYLISSIYF